MMNAFPWTAHPVTLPTLYAVNVQATPRQCKPPTDVRFVVVGAVLGGVFTLAVTIAGAVVILETCRPDLLPRWVGRVRRLRYLAGLWSDAVSFDY